MGDLNVIARGTAWDAALKTGELRVIEPYAIQLVVVDDYITIGTTWSIGDFSVNSLIDTAELIHGIPCVLLKHVVAYKRIADRPKDREHLAIIRSHWESALGT